MSTSSLWTNSGNEQIQVGFNLAHGTEILHQSTWGYFEEVAVLTPSKVRQFAHGYKANKSITKNSYYAVAKFSGEHKHATDVLEKAVKAWAMHEALALNTAITDTTKSSQIHAFLIENHVH